MGSCESFLECNAGVLRCPVDKTHGVSVGIIGVLLGCPADIPWVRSGVSRG
jgi:hypothetical protein